MVFNSSSGFNPYAAGAKNYSGSSAATTGTVDPMGYIDRENNKSPEYSRSGIAAAALDRVRNGPQVSSAAGTSYNVPTGYQPMLASPTGQIQLNPLDRSDLDTNYSQSAADAVTQKGDLDTQYSHVAQDLESQRRDAQDAQVKDSRGALNNFASRGMGLSTGYGTEAADIGTQYQGVYNQIGTALQNAAQQRDQGKSAIDLALERLRGATDTEWAHRQTDYAGSLHLQQDAETQAQQAAQAQADAARAAAMQQTLGTNPPAPSHVASWTADGKTPISTFLKNNKMTMDQFLNLNPNLKGKVNAQTVLQAKRSFRYS